MSDEFHLQKLWNDASMKVWGEPSVIKALDWYGCKETIVLIISSKFNDGVIGLTAKEAMLLANRLADRCAEMPKNDGEELIA